MDPNNMTELDRMIEEALKSEPLRPVPNGFHRRVEERVRVAAFASQERRGFHSRLWASAVLFAMLGFTLVLVPALAFFQGWTVRALPGAMGYLDYLTVFFMQSWGEILLALAGAAGVVGAVAAVWMIVPLVRGKSAHQQQ
ncbi:MAG TPA: hypothetical protein PLJ47_14525 [Candidatus Hydrogenedentes bacterium]|nr:hypothetical protein [Candidatus Hydrogenedentota bacterium]